MPPTFIFVRHGEAKHNVAYHATDEKAFEDETNRDAPLTYIGIKQANETGKKLSSFNIQFIWSSPLTRCIQTAEEILEETSGQIICLHDNLLERQGGNHVCNERKTKTEIEEKLYCANTKFLPERPAYWNKREDWTALHYRMRAFILMLANIYEHMSEKSYVVIVSHKDAIFSLIKKDLLKAEFVVMTLDEILNVTKKIE
jgi:broad specificity phosphatase PhoE